MRDNKCHTAREGGYLCRINSLPGNHFIGDPRNCGDRGRDRPSGITEFLESLMNLKDATIKTVSEGHHGELDDFVVGRIQTRRFDVQKQPKPGL